MPGTTRRISSRTSVAQFAARLMSIQEDERHRIARDLHDNVGQHLSGLRLALEYLAARKGNDELLHARLAAALATLRTIDDALEGLAKDLRPAALDLGLSSAIKHLVDQWSNSFGIAAEFHSRNLSSMRLPQAAETHLYRIAQEALTNVYKHARATQVAVLLDRNRDRLRLIIEDNGRGFRTTRSHRRRRGHGLTSLSERAALIGATLTVESSRNGTSIFVHVPKAFGRRSVARPRRRGRP